MSNACVVPARMICCCLGFGPQGLAPAAAKDKRRLLRKMQAQVRLDGVARACVSFCAPTARKRMVTRVHARKMVAHARQAVTRALADRAARYSVRYHKVRACCPCQA